VTLKRAASPPANENFGGEKRGLFYEKKRFEKKRGRQRNILTSCKEKGGGKNDKKRIPTPRTTPKKGRGGSPARGGKGGGRKRKRKGNPQLLVWKKPYRKGEGSPGKREEPLSGCPGEKKNKEPRSSPEKRSKREELGDERQLHVPGRGDYESGGERTLGNLECIEKE